MTKNSKFTLLELMIVVAIIGILLTLLLPSLRNAKYRAQLAVCASNHAQTITAIHIYSKDNNHWFPNKYQNSGNWLARDGNMNWSGLGKLVKHNLMEQRALYCPTWTHPVANYNTMDPTGVHGGFHEDDSIIPSQYTWIGSAYRQHPFAADAHLSNQKRKKPFHLALGSSNTAITTDQWTKRANHDYGFTQGSGDFGHQGGKSYTVSYADGSVNFVQDRSRSLVIQAISHAVTPVSLVVTREEKWRDFFDKE